MSPRVVMNESVLLNALWGVLSHLQWQDRGNLKELAKRLRQAGGGEEWAVGHMLDNACAFLNAYKALEELGAEGSHCLADKGEIR